MSSWPGDQTPGYGGSGQQDAWGSSGATPGGARERIQPPPLADQPPPADQQHGYFDQQYGQANQPYGYAQQSAALAQSATWAAPYAATQQAGYGAVQASSNGMAVASLVLGITSIVFCWWGLFSLLQVVLAIVFGCVGLSRANQGAGQSTLAITGIICACAGLMFYLIIGFVSLGIGLII